MSTAALENLLSTRDKTAADLARIIQLETDLAAEEKRLIAATDPEDDHAFKILGAVRLKRDCCPGKIEQINLRIQDLEKEILAETKRLACLAADVMRQRRDVALKEVAAAIQPHCDRPDESVALAEQTPAVRKLETEINSFTQGYSERDNPAQQAVSFLAHTAKVGVLQPKGQKPSLAPAE
jgi:hypothetical protein